VFNEHAIDAVLHFAASAYVGESMSDPQKYFRNNVANTLNLLNAMVQAGVKKIVFSSSCATYGLPQNGLLEESHPQCPVNPYGESKLFVERALHWYGKSYGLKWVALRYFNAAGADPDGELGECHTPETHLIPLAIEAALRKRRYIEVFGTDYPTPDGTAIRDYIHVMDLAEAHVLALDTPYFKLRDPDGLRANALAAKNVGFKGKFAIHPEQIAALNECFSPSAQEVAHAQRVVAAFEEAETRGRGSTSLDGWVIDVPVVKRARALLELARRAREEG